MVVITLLVDWCFFGRVSDLVWLQWTLWAPSSSTARAITLRPAIAVAASSSSKDQTRLFPTTNHQCSCLHPIVDLVVSSVQTLVRQSPRITASTLKTLFITSKTTRHQQHHKMADTCSTANGTGQAVGWVQILFWVSVTRARIWLLEIHRNWRENQQNKVWTLMLMVMLVANEVFWRWLKPVNNSMMVLTTNDKTIKLWKVHKKKVKSITSFNIAPKAPAVCTPHHSYCFCCWSFFFQGASSKLTVNSLQIPQITVRDTVMHATPRYHHKLHSSQQLYTPQSPPPYQSHLNLFFVF